VVPGTYSKSITITLILTRRQYTKIFCGPHALKPLLIGVCVGLPLGFILEHEAPDFKYSDVVALASATWTVAILSLFAGKIIGKFEDHIPLITKGSYDEYSGPGVDQSWSQPELKGFYHQLEGLPRAEKMHIEPQSASGHQVSRLLNRCGDSKLTDLAQRAFPEAEHLLRLSGKLFNEGKVKIELVSIEHFSKYDHAMRAVSHTGNTSVSLLVGCKTKCISTGRDHPPGFYQE